MAQLETNKPPKVRVNKRRSNENLTGWLFAMPWVIGLLLFFWLPVAFVYVLQLYRLQYSSKW